MVSVPGEETVSALCTGVLNVQDYRSIWAGSIEWVETAMHCILLQILPTKSFPEKLSSLGLTLRSMGGIYKLGGDLAKHCVLVRTLTNNFPELVLSVPADSSCSTLYKSVLQLLYRVERAIVSCGRELQKWAEV